MNDIKFKKKYDDPMNLPELEQRRWNAHLRFLNIIEERWDPLCDQIKKAGKIYGYHKTGTRYYFENTEYGMIHDSFNGTINPLAKVCMMEEDELPLYINYPDNNIVGYVKQRLEGILHQFPRNDDFVQRYFKIEKMIVTCSHFKELSLKIIEEHVREIEKYSIEKSSLKLIYPSISLNLNGRLYIWNKDKFILKPDDVQLSLSPTGMKRAYKKLHRYRLSTSNIKIVKGKKI